MVVMMTVQVACMKMVDCMTVDVSRITVVESHRTAGEYHKTVVVRLSMMIEECSTMVGCR